jgi:hypothetical protein
MRSEFDGSGCRVLVLAHPLKIPIAKGLIDRRLGCGFEKARGAKVLHEATYGELDAREMLLQGSPVSSL